MNDGYPPWHLKEQESAGSGITSSDLCSEGRFQAVGQEEKMCQCSYERTQKLLFMEGELTIFHWESSRKKRTFLITLKILIWVVIKLSEAENRTFIRKEKARTFQTSHKVPSYRDGEVIGASFVLRHLNKHTLEIHVIERHILNESGKTQVICLFVRTKLNYWMGKNVKYHLKL